MKLLLALLVICSIAYCHAAPKSPELKGRRSVEDEVVEELIPGGVVGPLKEALSRQLKSILGSLKDQVGHLNATVRLHLRIIASLLKPYLRKIIDEGKATGKTIVEIKRELSDAVKNLISSLIDISGENMRAVKAVVDYIITIIFDDDATPKNNFDIDNFFIIDRIIGKILQPSLAKINEILTKIADLSKEKTDEAKKLIEVYLNELVKVLEPHVVKIVDILQDMGIKVKDSLDYVKSVLTYMIKNLKGLTEANKKLFLTLLDYIFRAIKGEITDPNAVVVNYESYLIIDRIITRILSPIIKKLNDQLEAIKKAIENQSNNITNIIKKHAENIAEILRPYMIRIINILNDLGVDAKDTYEKIKAALNLIIENLRGISEENKKILKTLVDYIASVIMGGKTPDETSLTTAIELNNNYLIRGIIEKLLRPLANLVKTQIQSIIKSLKDQAGHLNDSIKEHLKRLAGLLKPAVDIIIKHGAGIINSGSDIKEQVTQALEYIFGVVQKVTGVSLEATKEIITYLVKILTGGEI